MQSGTGNADQWFLEFEQKDHKAIDPVMSWIGSSDQGISSSQQQGRGREEKRRE